jgi:hypothetical protein
MEFKPMIPVFVCPVLPVNRGILEVPVNMLAYTVAQYKQ